MPGAWHEPAGLALITDRPFNSLASTTSDTKGAEGWDPIEARYPNFAIVQDPTAPLSPPNVLRTRYPAGFGGGSAPGTLQDNNARWVTPGRYRTLYHRFAVKLDPHFVGHPTSTNKLFHVWVGADPGSAGNRIFYRAVCAGSAPCDFQVALQGAPDARTRFPANVGNGVMGRGVWITYEVELALNTPGQSDGRLDVWTDGQLTHHYTDLEIAGPGETLVYQQIQWSPTWGGGGSTVPATFDVWLDGVVAAGR